MAVELELCADVTDGLPSGTGKKEAQKMMDGWLYSIAYDKRIPLPGRFVMNN